MTKEIIRYGIAGMINTFVGYGVFIFIVFFMNFDPYYANGLGYCIALCVAFLLNKYYVFNKKETDIYHVIRFFIAFLIAYIINLIILFICLDFLELNLALGQIFAMISYTASFYIFNKYIVF